MGAALGAGAGAVERGGADRLVAGDRGRLGGGREKGGGAVGRTLRGRSGSRFHLIVDATGVPFAIRIGPGNENERAHLLPLLDALLARGIVPAELWADRGYDGEQLRAQTRLRGVEPVISRRRRASDPAPPPRTPTILRGNTRRPHPPDPHARQRLPVERTNAWLKAMRRIATRRDRKATTYHAFLHLGMIIVLTRALLR